MVTNQQIEESLDAHILHPLNSVLSGKQIVNACFQHGVNISVAVTILRIETAVAISTGGGEFVKNNNFGCIKAGPMDTDWGRFASGTFTYNSRTWYKCSNPENGLQLFLRYLKGAKNGLIWGAIDTSPPDWYTFTRYYYSNTPTTDAFKRYQAKCEKYYTHYTQAIATGIFDDYVIDV